MHWWKSAVGDTHVTLNCTWQHLCCIAHWRSANLTLNIADCTIVRCKLDIPKCTAQLAAHCTCYIALCIRIVTLHSASELLHCTLHQNLVVVTHTSSLGNNQPPATPRHLYDSCHFSHYFTELFCIIFSRLLQLCHPIQDCSRVVFFIFVL